MSHKIFEHNPSKDPISMSRKVFELIERDYSRGETFTARDITSRFNLTNQGPITGFISAAKNSGAIEAVGFDEASKVKLTIYKVKDLELIRKKHWPTKQKRQNEAEANLPFSDKDWPSTERIGHPIATRSDAAGIVQAETEHGVILEMETPAAEMIVDTPVGDVENVPHSQQAPGDSLQYVVLMLADRLNKANAEMSAAFTMIAEEVMAVSAAIEQRDIERDIKRIPHDILIAELQRRLQG